MKIGFSTSVIQRGKTGVAQYVFALLKALESIAPGEQFVLFVLEKDKKLFEKLSPRFEISLVDEIYRPPIKNILWHQWQLPRIARQLDLDLVHIPSYRRMIWRSPCPRVATIHDLAPFHVSKKYDLARMFYGRVVVKRLARVQERIITVSHNTARDLENFFKIPTRRIKTIHNGVDHERFFPQNEVAARAVALDKFKLNKPFFLYVARLEHPGKNHVRLIESFDQFKSKTSSDWLLALGGSDWHGAEAIHERIAQSPFRHDIRSLGFVADDELPALYSSAASFVYPSLFEGFGLPPIEAMACGTPVICSARGSLGEVVQRAALIVEPEDISSMTDALARFYSSSDLREDFRQKGLLRAADFSWKRAALETLAVYSAVVAGRRSFARSAAMQSVSVPSAPLD